MSLHRICRAVLAGPLLVAGTPAFAHHVMDGKAPTTFAEGLLSGLGHPVIGPDHLAFLVAVGIAVGAGRLHLALPVAFVATMAMGVGMRVVGMAVPAGEFIVGLSVLLAGLLLARGRALPAAAWILLFAVAGLFHGYAFGEAILGGESSPLVAYLLGLAAVQALITIGIALLARRMAAGASALQPRLVGAAVLGVGLAVLAQRLMPGA